MNDSFRNTILLVTLTLIFAMSISLGYDLDLITKLTELLTQPE